MTTIPLPGSLDEVTFDHRLVIPDDDTAATPTVLVFHGMEGRSDAQMAIAERLTGWGYRAVAVDLFGEAVTAGGPQRCAEEMTAFLSDRAALATRLSAVLDALLTAPQIDAGRTAAIGFCFGGLCVLDVARAGHPLRAVVSFHGLLTPPGGSSARGNTGKTLPRIAVHHGWDDPLAPPEDVVALGRELTARGADWQLHAYGGAMHAFMAPFADQPERGIQYHPVVAERAWRSLGVFLRETFGD
ncbi:carboxymethylenebutenolidase [Mycobacterium sp. PS03-16]|uniref:dienelactone hydrolase family protein n=1 Tax=Mycobacterium sp. PS03-16 TaxID=2559611 RepID=UPI001073139C|nr:dienelactone hydrolase family protein [Mycobacterium sp. PS03-16]TFV55072.1 carboxymethylenebutenolidase [Mycobacterium sp. PS03-16]